MGSITAQSPFGEIPDALLSLFRAQLRWSQDYFEAVTGQKVPATTDPLRAVQQMVPKPVCHVPPPCWMPASLGEVTSFVDRCGRACVRLIVTNCDRAARGVSVRVEGLEGVEVNPASVQLGPMQRATVEIGYEVPEGTDSGTSREALVWVDGCRQHFLRWTVSVASVGLDSCYEVRVDDCPDYRHHWYDHFYCPRPCPSGGRSPVG